MYNLILSFIMKHVISVLIVFMCSVFCVQAASKRDEILDKGHWGDDDARSFVPAPPKAYPEEGKSISLNFITSISDLKVIVTDSTGAIVYEEVVSISAPQSYLINLNNLDNGDYTLTVSHQHGDLSGSFTL